MNARKRLLLVVAVVALLGAALPTLAQDAIVEEPRPEAAATRPAVIQFRGVVISIEGTAIQLRTLEATVTFQTGERTRYRIPGMENPTLADVNVGDLANIAAVRRAGGLFAAAVQIVPERIGLDGDITQIAGNNVKIDNPSGEIVIHTDENTRFRVPGVENPTLADLAVGDHIHGWAVKQGQGSFWGRLLAVVDEHRLRGQVSAIAGTALTVKTPEGTLTFQTDDHTRYRVPGVENPTLANVQVGDLVGILAFGQPDGTLLARGIGVLRGIRFQGTVTARNGAVLTINTAKGAVDVLTDAQTRYFVPGIENPTLDDIAVGDRVGVAAVTRGPEGGLLAEGIKVLPQLQEDTAI